MRRSFCDNANEILNFPSVSCVLFVCQKCNFNKRSVDTKNDINDKILLKICQHVIQFQILNLATVSPSMFLSINPKTNRFYIIVPGKIILCFCLII